MRLGRFLEKQEGDINRRTSWTFRFFNRPVISILLESKPWQLNFRLVSNVDFQL